MNIYKWGKWAYRLHYYWIILQIKLPPLFAKSELVDHALNRIFLFNVLQLIVIHHLHQSELWIEYLSIYLLIYLSISLSYIYIYPPETFRHDEILPSTFPISITSQVDKDTRKKCWIVWLMSNRAFRQITAEGYFTNQNSENDFWWHRTVWTATVFHFKVHFNNIGPWKSPANGTLPLKAWLYKSIDKIDGWNFTPFTKFFI